VTLAGPGANDPAQEWTRSFLERHAEARATTLSVPPAGIDQVLRDAADLIVLAEGSALASGLLRRAPRPLLFLPGVSRAADAPILALVDLSAESLAAAQRAIDLAATDGLGVELLHLFPIPYASARATRPDARRGMAEFVRQLTRGGVTLTTRVELAAIGGYVALSAVAAIRAGRYSQVFIGSRRRSWWVAFLFGFAAQHIVRHAGLPVWVIRDDRPLGFLEAMGREQP